jgi:hypothetical protein
MQMLLIFIVLAASACSGEAVRCDGHLTAINGAATAGAPSRGRGGAAATSTVDDSNPEAPVGSTPVPGTAP